MTVRLPALAQLKDGKQLPQSALPDLLARAFAEKEIPPAALAHLLMSAPEPFSRLLASFWMREDGPVPGVQEALAHSLQQPFLVSSYQGTAQENALIDRRISSSSAARSSRAWIGWGSCFTLAIDAQSRLPETAALLQTPILILGAGASGILVARALTDLGFHHLTVIDQEGGYGGIWNRPALKLIRANPLTLRYRGPDLHASVARGPGSGERVSLFLQHLVQGQEASQPLPDVQPLQVHRIMPGDLAHAVLVSDGSGERVLRSPILINALGVGQPLPLSNHQYMQTDSEEHVEHRWQEPLTHNELVQWQGKRVLFVGLSNSTLTMLQQMQHAIDQGHDLAYTVLTHHPHERIAMPLLSGLYRNLAGGLLTGLAGDVPEVHRALMRARTSTSQREQLLPDVAFWSIRPQADKTHHLLVRRRDGRSRTMPGITRVYGLTGYGHSTVALHAMGMGVQEDRVLLDADGEVQFGGSRRLSRGYFAIGPVAQGQPNGAILPGILYRVGELLPTLLARAAEYAALSQR